jgi:hypothetical protein
MTAYSTGIFPWPQKTVSSIELSDNNHKVNAVVKESTLWDILVVSFWQPLSPRLE